MMFGKFSADPSSSSAATAAGGRFSLVELRRLHQQLVENKEVNAQNEAVVVEILRVLAEMVVYGDNKSELLFDFFCEKNMLSLFLEVMWTEGGCPSAVHIQILQTLSILISCVKNDTSLYYLLSNNRINEIIIYPHDFDRDESLCAQFASFMKSLSLKLNEQTVQFFFIEETGAFPILSRAVELLHIPDPMIRVASQSTILNVYRVEDNRARAYALQDEVMRDLFQQMVRIMTAQFNSISETCAIYAKASTELDEAGTTKLEYVLEDQLAAAEDWFYYLQDLLDLPIPALKRALIAFLDGEFLQTVLLAPLLRQYGPSSSRTHQSPPSSTTAVATTAAAAVVADTSSTSRTYQRMKNDLEELNNTLKINSALSYLLQMLRVISHPLLHRAVMVALFHPVPAHQRSVLASEIINSAIEELNKHNATVGDTVVSTGSSDYSNNNAHGYNNSSCNSGGGSNKDRMGRFHSDSAVQSSLIEAVQASEQPAVDTVNSSNSYSNGSNSNGSSDSNSSDSNNRSNNNGNSNINSSNSIAATDAAAIFATSASAVELAASIIVDSDAEDIEYYDCNDSEGVDSSKLASRAATPNMLAAMAEVNPMKAAWEMLMVQHSQKLVLVAAEIMHMFVDKLNTELMTAAAAGNTTILTGGSNSGDTSNCYGNSDGDGAVKIAVDDAMLQQQEATAATTTAAAADGGGYLEQNIGEEKFNEYDRTAIQCVQVLLSMHFLPEVEQVLTSEEREIRNAIKAVEKLNKRGDITASTASTATTAAAAAVDIEGASSAASAANEGSFSSDHEAIFDMLGITKAFVQQRMSELSFEASAYQFVDDYGRRTSITAAATAATAAGTRTSTGTAAAVDSISAAIGISSVQRISAKQSGKRRALTLTGDVQQLVHHDLRTVPVLLRMRQLLLYCDSGSSSAYALSPSTAELLIAVLQQARNYSLLVVQATAHTVFNLCAILSKAAHQKLDVDAAAATADFRPISLIFGHVNIENLEQVAARESSSAAAAAAEVDALAADSEQQQQQQQQLPDEEEPNYVPYRILQYLIEQIRSAVRFSAMVLLDRLDGPFSEILLMLIKEETRRFEDQKWKSSIKKMYQDPLLFLPATAANFDRFGIDFDLPISQTEVIRKDIQTFLLLKELCTRLQRMQKFPHDPDHFAVELCKGINDRSFLNLEEENIIPGGLCVDAQYDMKGKRFLDTKVAPDYVPAVYNLAATDSSYSSSNNNSTVTATAVDATSSSGSASLLTALGSFGLSQSSPPPPQQQQQQQQQQSSNSNSSSNSSSSGGGTTAASFMPLTTRQKLLFVQDNNLLMISFSCKIESKNAFRLFLVAPLIYVDAQVDPLDGRKFTVLIRSSQLVPRTVQLQGDISLLMAEMNDDDAAAATAAVGETAKKRFLSPRRFLSLRSNNNNNGRVLRNGNSSSSTRPQSYSKPNNSSAAAAATTAGGKRIAQRFLKPADASTFWQLGLCMDTVQACRLATLHIENKRKELNQQKLDALKNILQSWVTAGAATDNT